MHCIRSSIPIIVFAVVAGGCGSAATVFDPADLRKPTVDRTIRLDEDYSFETQLGGINNVVARVTVLSGVYRADYEDANGTYFLGPKDCYRSVNLNSDAPGLLNDCGIYLPNAKDLAPRMYIYRKGPAQQADTTNLAAQATPKGAAIVPSAAGAALGGAIVEGIVASDQNKPRFMGAKMQPDGAVFRARLKTE